MEMPLSMVIENLKQNLANEINSAGLHISIVEAILGELYSEVRLKAKEVYDKDKAKFIEENKKESETKQ